jgi:hypothetical protein
LALGKVGLAAVHVLAREPEPACAAAGDALDMAGRIRSERLTSRLRRTAKSAVDLFGDLPSVRRLANRLLGELPEAAFPLA